MRRCVGINQYSTCIAQFHRSADSGVFRSDYSRRTKRNEKVHIFQTVHVSLCKIKKALVTNIWMLSLTHRVCVVTSCILIIIFA